MVTPLTENHKIDTEAVKQILDYDYEEGAYGFYICGTTGEGPVLSLQNRMELAECVMSYNSGRGAVIDHIGAASPEDAFLLARHAREIGCSAVSSVVPNFFYRYDENEILEYYKRLSDEAGIPVLAYAQGLIGSTDVVSLMKKLMSVDGIIGIKYTMTNYYDLHRIKELCGGDINVINGPDEMLICGLTMGADAGIGSTYNVMCREYCKLYNAFVSGDFETAVAQQYKVNRIIEIIIRHGVIRTVKYMLSFVGINAGNTCFPGEIFSEEEKNLIKKELDETGFFTVYNK